MKARANERRYRQLDPERITQTVGELAGRIRGKFPASGLALVGDDLVLMTREAIATSRRIRKPDVIIRVMSILVAAFLVGLIVFASFFLRVQMSDEVPLLELFQAIESMVNDIIFAALAIWFAFSLETRRKRHIVLGLISQLRALAHVIDMHQLTKDPNLSSVIIESDVRANVPSQLTPSDLTRYLDFCSEMLALLSKLGALQLQAFEDPVSLEAMTDLEDLTTGLSGKIWQKIMIADRLK